MARAAVNSPESRPFEDYGRGAASPAIPSVEQFVSQLASHVDEVQSPYSRDATIFSTDRVSYRLSMLS